MIRTFLDLQVKPEHAEALIALFEAQAVVDQSVAQPGCHSAELSVSDDGLAVTVTAVWDSVAAYETWTARDDRASLSELINRHLAVPVTATTTGRIHRVAIRRVAPSHDATNEAADRRDHQGDAP